MDPDEFGRLFCEADMNGQLLRHAIAASSSPRRTSPQHASSAALPRAELLEAVAVDIAKKGIVGCCLSGSVMFAEILRKEGADAHVVAGFQVIEDAAASWHCWVESDGHVYDIGNAAAGVAYGKQGIRIPQSVPCRAEEFSRAQLRGVERIDTDTPEEREVVAANEAAFDVYARGGPDAFWKRARNDAPPHIYRAFMNLRRKYLRNSRKGRMR